MCRSFGNLVTGEIPVGRYLSPRVNVASWRYKGQPVSEERAMRYTSFDKTAREKGEGIGVRTSVRRGDRACHVENSCSYRSRDCRQARRQREEQKLKFGGTAVHVRGNRRGMNNVSRIL